MCVAQTCKRFRRNARSGAREERQVKMDLGWRILEGYLLVLLVALLTMGPAALLLHAFGVL